MGAKNKNSLNFSFENQRIFCYDFFMSKSAKKYYLWTLGCQINQSDAERAAVVLENLGYQKTDQADRADLIMVVACSVRQSAVDRILGRSRHWQGRRIKGELVTILTGCVLRSDQKKFGNKFDLIFKISDLPLLSEKFADLAIYCQKNKKTPTRIATRSVAGGKKQKNKERDYFCIKPKYESKFQAQVPIMTGCDNFCAYCVVPLVRGREISRPATEIINECRALIKLGYKEIILLGQNVNSYGKKTINNFSGLLRLIDAIPGDYWLSFITSHPKDLSDDLLKIMAKGKHLMPYLHLPIQSGDNEILKKMNRHYTVAHYKKLIKKARQLIPGLAISTDVIVGLPGESQKRFNNTAKLMKELKFDMAYIAQYSPRAGTAAAKLKDDVSREEKKRRWQILTEILAQTALVNNQKLVGQTIEVLVEKWEKNKNWGKTNTFKLVNFFGAKSLVGKIVKVKITGAGSWGLTAEK